MKEYKRLTEKGKKWIESNHDEVEVYNRLAELEDKIENGTLIELPCKVGDMVYVIDYYNNIEEVSIFDYTLTPKGFTFTVCNEDILSKYYLFDFDFNKDWFLTKAEAEAKLKELQNER